MEVMTTIKAEPTNELMATLTEFKSVMDEFTQDELSSVASSYIVNADTTTKEIVNQAKSRGIDLTDENWDNAEVSKDDKTFVSDSFYHLVAHPRSIKRYLTKLMPKESN